MAIPEPGRRSRCLPPIVHRTSPPRPDRAERPADASVCGAAGRVSTAGTAGPPTAGPPECGPFGAPDRRECLRARAATAARPTAAGDQIANAARASMSSDPRQRYRPNGRDHGTPRGGNFSPGGGRRCEMLTGVSSKASTDDVEPRVLPAGRHLERAAASEAVTPTAKPNCRRHRRTARRSASPRPRLPATVMATGAPLTRKAGTEARHLRTSRADYEEL